MGTVPENRPRKKRTGYLYRVPVSGTAHEDVFAGRVADTGVDPVPHMMEAKKLIAELEQRLPTDKGATPATSA